VAAVVEQLQEASRGFDEMTMLKRFLRRFLQDLVILLARPYVSRELPGWGKVYGVLVGDYRRDWFWRDAPIRTIRGKLNGYKMRLDLSAWSSRSTYFLGRWRNLEMQLFVKEVIRPDDTVLDVGANHGMFALTASSLLGEMGKVICFEPNPRCLEILDREIAENQIRNILVHRVGLGEQDAELFLSVPFVNSGEGTFGVSHYGEEAIYQVKVKVVRGDDLLIDQRPRIIKIDVEGFECNVLAGLAKTINMHHPIVVTEIVPDHLAACGFSVADLVSLMRRFGYEGRVLRLTKQSGRYTWTTEHLRPDSRTNCDAIWIHPASEGGAIVTANSSMR